MTTVTATILIATVGALIGVVLAVRRQRAEDDRRAREWEEKLRAEAKRAAEDRGDRDYTDRLATARGDLPATLLRMAWHIIDADGWSTGGEQRVDNALDGLANDASAKRYDAIVRGDFVGAEGPEATEREARSLATAVREDRKRRADRALARRADDALAVDAEA